MIEIIIYLSIGILCMAYRRVISGIKNGAFYGKNNKKARPEIKPYIKNIHKAETPAWYTQFVGMGAFVFAIARLLNPEISFLTILFQFIASSLIVMGTSGLASNDFQKWINRGAGLPDFDPKENEKSEFAWGNVSIWWNTWWVGKFRKILPYLAALEIIIGIIWIFFFI